MFRYITILLLVFCSFQSKAQQIGNLQSFDRQIIHFGFVLGYNQADFYMEPNQNRVLNDTIMVMQVDRRPGFNLGIVSSLNPTPNFKIRFIPTLSFQERGLEYTFYQEPDTTEFWVKPVESVFLDFPLLFKFRTNRINNFAAYMITGGRFGLDMSSNKDVKNSTASLQDQIVKIQKADFGYEIGGGFDFFLEYFKFGIELKLGVGRRNMLIQENLKFSDPIGSLRSKVWTVSLTFEG